ncbi:MAG: fibrillarin-like rRNA/tRNA 2'-O-methyltransferase [Candidatus Lokiarchaeota archaeon]|nr:fibrillarin-like rRNA/tRNA 2'-O-methyltransferase [Candidatus Harpocratesius repetitus]
MGRIRRHPKFDGVFISGPNDNFRLYTVNLDTNRTIYGEKLFEENGIQYREWNPYRSKLGASIRANARKIFLDRNSRLLYLGASSGTTVSHCSDIITNGIIYAVEFSARSLRELVQNCADRPNVIPILADANHPYEYAPYIYDRIDVIFQDVAQPNQTEILIKNIYRYLKPKEGKFIYAIKSRSIDTTVNPNEIFEKEINKLEAAGMQIMDNVSIEKFQNDHIVLFGRYLEHP